MLISPMGYSSCSIDNTRFGRKNVDSPSVNTSKVSDEITAQEGFVKKIEDKCAPTNEDKKYSN